MRNQYLFPFSDVKKKSKIIIYGAGEVGRQYLSQVMHSGYCDCLYLVDRNHKSIEQIAGVEVNAPEKLSGSEFDKVIIASIYSADEIYKLLLSYNIPHEKIVNKVDPFFVESIDYGFVFIRDYRYDPKSRKSLHNSRIGDIMDKWYVGNKEETVDFMKKFCSYKKQYEKIQMESSVAGELHWGCGYTPPFDAISIYGFLA